MLKNFGRHDGGHAPKDFPRTKASSYAKAMADRSKGRMKGKMADTCPLHVSVDGFKIKKTRKH